MIRDGRWTRHLFHLSFLALVGSALFLASCSQRQTVMEEPNFEPTPGKTYTAPKVAEAMPESLTLDNTYFDYDKATLKPVAYAALRKSAGWLKKHPNAQVQIEGTCDERGTYEYNLRLGEQRARAAKRFLVKQGIAESRIATTSGGAIPGSQPNKMAKNRHAAFIVYFKE